MSFYRSIAPFILLLFSCAPGYAHDIITTEITFDREIVRIFNARCVSCHRSGGSAFSLMTYQDARPWAKAIEEEVLERRMPPWGAVKGFGHFRNDQALSQEQLETIVDWIEGGVPEGEKEDLPESVGSAAAQEPPPSASLPNEMLISGDTKLTKALVLDGLWPKSLGESGGSFQITAELPDGTIAPLLWLYNYKPQYSHAFLLRSPLELPAGTLIRGLPPGATLALLPAATAHRPGATRPPASQ